MLYFSAFIAILGAVGYQYFVKQVPGSINPIVSVIGMYVAVLVLSFILLPIFPPEGGLVHHIRKLNWVQLALAVTVLLIELGFLLMYRYGMDLSTGNLIIGVFVNLILLVLGITLLGEKISTVNAAGIFLCIIGAVLIGYKP